MSDRATMLTAAAVMVTCLAGAAIMGGSVRRQRDALELVVSTDDVAGMPPHVAVVTAALGTFRGLAVDILWARADHLQTQGEFYEAQTLSQWITTLQPRFQKVWGFQAWNMAWNIAAATQVPAERWGWVNRGIELLRSRGIPLNPRSANLYFDLAWIFQNKIGRVGDKEHWYYKARLAREMQEFLGDLTGGKTTAEAIARFRRISEAPETLEELEARVPDVRRALRLLADHAAKPDEATVRMLGRVLMLTTSLDATLIGPGALPPGTNRELLDALRTDKETAAIVIEHVVPFVQKRILEDRYRMDTAGMLRLMERYGPLDWRHPESHGIYWSEKGIEVSRSLQRREDVNELMLVRGRLFMLMNLMRAGRVEFDAATNRVDLLPAPQFARAYEDAIREAFELIASDQGVSAADFGFAQEEDLFDAYERFLNVATMLCYLYGDHGEAIRYFGLLREFVGRRGYGDEPVYSDTLENFVALRFAGIAGVDPTNLRQFLDAMIRRAIVDGLGRGDMRLFGRSLDIAHSVYDRRFATSRPGEAFVLEEAKLLEFPKLLDNSFAAVMKDATLPVIARARIWHWAPERLRQAVYMPLAEGLASQAVAAGLDPVRAFPAPPRVEDESPDEPPAAASDGDGKSRASN
jgi:hypothetical protein